MSIDEKTDVEGDKPSLNGGNGNGLQAFSGPADGSAPKYRDEEQMGGEHEVRINGIGEYSRRPHYCQICLQELTVPAVPGEAHVQRTLKERHLSMIAIGGSIGTVSHYIT